MHGCNITYGAVEHHTWGGVRQHPKRCLVFVGVNTPLKMEIKHLVFNSVVYPHFWSLYKG